MDGDTDGVGRMDGEEDGDGGKVALGIGVGDGGTVGRHSSDPPAPLGPDADPASGDVHPRTPHSAVVFWLPSSTVHALPSQLALPADSAAGWLIMQEEHV